MANRSNPFSNLNFDLPSMDFSNLDMPNNLDDLEAEINARFDEFEASLPAPLDAMFRIQRSMFNSTYSLTKSAAEQMNEANSAMMKQAQSSAQRFINAFLKQVKLVQGQTAKSAAATTAAASGSGAKPKATATAPAKTAKPAKPAKAATAADYNKMTKDELYDLAQKLDIEGRSSMTKAQLVKAVRAAKG